MSEPQQARAPSPWGPWMSLVFGAIIFLVYSIAQGLGLVPLLVLQHLGGTPPRDLHASVASGFNLSLATMASCPVMLLLCALFVWARQGPSLTSYLAIRPVTWKSVILWTAAMIVVAFAFSTLNDLFHRDPPAFIVSTYATAGYLPLLWAAIAVCAPLAEEIWMRGFVFAGLAASRLGTTWTIVITSVLFALVHAGQYEWIDLTHIAVVGALLGLARARTQSVLPPLAMHIGLNLTSLTLYETSDYAADRG